MSREQNRDRSLNYSQVLSATTPNVRQRDTSRISRRSAAFSNTFNRGETSVLENDSPSILHVKKTPVGRTRIQEKSSSVVRSHNSSFKAVSFPNTSDISFSEYEFTGLMSPSVINFATPFKSQLRDGKKIANISTLVEDDPGPLITNSLYTDFAELYLSKPSETQVFDLLLGFEKACEELIPLLRQLLVKSSTMPNSRTYSMLFLLIQERNSWRLARTLYQDRLTVYASPKKDSIMKLISTRYSDKQIVDNLFENDDLIRQNQIVVDWLEKNMGDDLENNFASKMEYFSESHIGWENTLHHLRNTSKNTINYGVRPMVTEMDPDASYRQKLPLHDLDQEDENRLFKHIFIYVMSGKVDEAQKVAERHGYLWLAAIMEGWRPHHDPNYNATLHEGYELKPIEGNINRDIWKATCWQTIEIEALSPYERGIYAALSGHLKGILSVCSSWDECLWAYSRVLIDVKVEEEIRGHTTSLDRPLVKLPTTNWNAPTSMEQVFQELEASSNHTIQSECSNYQRIVQKNIILNSVDELLEAMNNWVDELTDLPHHLHRFMAHFVLFLRLIGWSEKEEICLNILESYVLVLIVEDQKSLVANYVATLPANRQIALYAKFLEDIFDKTDQRNCLEWAEKADLDVQLITKTVVENICSRQPTTSLDVRTHSNDPQLTIDTTKFDLEKIESLDWLIFDESQRAEATKQANSLLRKFIASRKLEASKCTLQKLPSDTVYIITRNWKRITDSDELEAEAKNSVKEYLCFQAYLQALESFNDWFNHIHHAKPPEPERPSGQTVKFTDWVAYEHSFKQYESDLDRWQQALAAQTKHTVDRLYNVLLFPDGGWMVDQANEEITDESRLKQMDLLRKLCLPQIAMLLQTVLHDTEQYKQCIALADVIADDKYGLYLEFNKQELRDFLSKMRESSLQMLDQNLDPFGYAYQ